MSKGSGAKTTSAPTINIAYRKPLQTFSRGPLIFQFAFVEDGYVLQSREKVRRKKNWLKFALAAQAGIALLQFTPGLGGPVRLAHLGPQLNEL